MYKMVRFLQVKFSGTTPLGTGLDRKVLQPLVTGPARSGQYPKPTLVIVITDGEPTGEPKDAVRQVIIGTKRFFESTPFGPGAVAFQFAQVSSTPLLLTSAFCSGPEFSCKRHVSWGTVLWRAQRANRCQLCLHDKISGLSDVELY